jgi:hypothetical protein
MVIKQKTILVSVGVAVVVIALFSWNSYIDRLYSDERLSQIGLDYAKSECLKSKKYSTGTCNTLHASASRKDATECHGKSCWIAVVRSSENTNYHADLVVVDEGMGRLVGQEYDDTIEE